MLDGVDFDEGFQAIVGAVKGDFFVATGFELGSDFFGRRRFDEVAADEVGLAALQGEELGLDGWGVRVKTILLARFEDLFEGLARALGFNLGGIDTGIPIGVDDAVVVAHGLFVVVNDELVTIDFEEAGGAEAIGVDGINKHEAFPIHRELPFEVPEQETDLIEGVFDGVAPEQGHFNGVEKVLAAKARHE